MLIVRERPGDAEEIRSVTAAAFASAEHAAPLINGEPGEAALVEWLRADTGWIPELSLAAIGVGGAIVGHVVCTRGRVGRHPALGLGPVSVVPDSQRAGVGSALMHAVVAAADARGEAMIAVLGDPRFYARFGFLPASTLGVEAPDPAWRAHLQLRTLTAHRPAMTGVLEYAAPFARL